MYEKRVARDAKWLDKVCPDWYTRVDTYLLDMTDQRCVIGQALGNFDEVMNQKFLIPSGFWETWKILLHPGIYVGTVWALTHGFEIFHTHCEGAWRQAWSNEIEKRRENEQTIYVPAAWEERDSVLS